MERATTKEKTDGNMNMTFRWQILAPRKNVDMDIVSNYVLWRMYPSFYAVYNTRVPSQKVNNPRPVRIS